MSPGRENGFSVLSAEFGSYRYRLAHQEHYDKDRGDHQTDGDQHGVQEAEVTDQVAVTHLGNKTEQRVKMTNHCDV